MQLFYPCLPSESTQISSHAPKNLVRCPLIPPFCDSCHVLYLTQPLLLWHHPHIDYTCGSVVQWIGQRFPVPSMWVRFPPGLFHKTRLLGGYYIVTNYDFRRTNFLTHYQTYLALLSWECINISRHELHALHHCSLLRSACYGSGSRA